MSATATGASRSTWAPTPPGFRTRSDRNLSKVAARWLGFLFVTAAVLVGTAAGASAHPYFLTSSPAPDSIVRASPAEIDITYTEALDYPYSKVQLVGPDQRVTDTHQVRASGPSTLAVVPNRPLSTQGTYVVGWTAVGQDGHTVTGSFAVSIGHLTARPDVTATLASIGGTSSGDGSLSDVLRTLLPVFTVVLAGLFLLAPVIAGAVAASGGPTPTAPSADPPDGAPMGEGDGRRALVSRRLAWLLRLSWAGLGLVVVGLSLHGVVANGLANFAASSSGRRLLVQVGLVAVAASIVFGRRVLPIASEPGRGLPMASGARRGRLLASGAGRALPMASGAGRARSEGRRSGWLQWAWGAVIAVALLIALAVSGHSESQPGSRRLLVISIYSVHMVAVAVWAGALAAVLLPLGRRRPLSDHVARLRPLVTVAILAVVVTGVADTRWGIRSIGQVAGTAYGRLVAAKFVLYLVMIVLGFVASAGVVRSASRARPALEATGRARPALEATGRARGRLMLTEAAIGTVVLVLAGTLSQLPQPIDVPFASQLFAASAGLPVSVGASGGDLVVASVSPGLVGANRIVVQDDDSDVNDFLHPVLGVGGIVVDVTCGCGHDVGLVTLQPVPGSAWWTADVDLPVAATWSLEASVSFQKGAGPSQPASGSPLQEVQLTARTLPDHLPDQTVIAIPADLSGPLGARCQDEALGLQVALDDINSQARDHGRLVRVVSVDIHNGVGPAMARIRSLDPVAVALPCGDPTAVAAAIAQARAWNIPVVADQATTTSRAGLWALGPDWSGEGRLLADQVHVQGAANVEVLAGSTAVDRQEVAATGAELTKLGIVYGVSAIPTNPARFATDVEAVDPDAMIIVADPGEALPTVEAMSNQMLQDDWRPSRGILASSQLMNTDFINDAGQETRLGVIEFASDIDPFDPVDQYYAERLRALVPGIRPTFDGVHGYIAGFALGTALYDGGGAPSPSRLTQLLGTHFASFGLGSYQASWTKAGGGASEVAVFRSTYVNPLAMPSNSPGGAQSMTHEGTFLDTGGFEQVAPFVKVSGT